MVQIAYNRSILFITTVISITLEPYFTFLRQLLMFCVYYLVDDIQSFGCYNEMVERASIVLD